MPAIEVVVALGHQAGDFELGGVGGAVVHRAVVPGIDMAAEHDEGSSSVAGQIGDQRRDLVQARYGWVIRRTVTLPSSMASARSFRRSTFVTATAGICGSRPAVSGIGVPQTGEMHISWM